MTTEYDLHFYFDSVCPFAWMTSKWVRMGVAQREHSVDLRFISLRIFNANIVYASHFPPEYEAGHERAAVGPLYEALGTRIFDTSLDDEIRAETEEALTLTGRDVGTPIPLANSAEFAFT